MGNYGLFQIWDLSIPSENEFLLSFQKLYHRNSSCRANSSTQNTGDPVKLNVRNFSSDDHCTKWFTVYENQTYIIRNIII